MNDKYCSGCNSFDQEIIRCDDNNAKCMWLLILTMLMGEENAHKEALHATSDKEKEGSDS